jgi:phage-related tail fiber protein
MLYYMKVTAIGAAKLAEALAAGTPLEITQMAVGDGNGADVTPPVGTEVALVHEVFRAPLSSLSESVSDPTIVLAEFPVPSATGGFYIREVGVFDDAGDLIGYGNFPLTYKPVPTDGTTRDMVVQAALKVGNSAAVTLVIDPNVVGATRAWVSSLFAPINSPTFTGTPKAPTPPTNDSSQLIPNTQWVTQRVESTAGNLAADKASAALYQLGYLL